MPFLALESVDARQVIFAGALAPRLELEPIAYPPIDTVGYRRPADVHGFRLALHPEPFAKDFSRFLGLGLVAECLLFIRLRIAHNELAAVAVERHVIGVIILFRTPHLFS